ncbi:MAG: twin-arginine translocation signal domain-containing protein [Caldilineaceae bacterium]|nr:twin-arginine translocation signal domain-containing protein [Caldilineaceae bacterium]
MANLLNNGMSRRDFLRTTSMMLAGGLIAACTPSSAPAAGGGSAPAAEGGTIQYWFGWGGNYAGVAWDTLKETETLKGILGDVTLETKGSSGGEPLLTAVAAGTPPEGASNTQYLDYMARGVLVPVGDWVDSSDTVKQEAYLEGTWKDAFDREGVMYGVPANEGYLRYGLVYNAEMVDEAGLDPDTPPETWDECLAWHEAITKFDDAGNLIQVGMDPFDAMGGQLAIQDGFYPAVSWNFSWFDSDAGTFNVDNEMMVQAFNTMGEFYKIVGPDNMAGMRQVEGNGMWGGSYNNRVQAMMIDGYWRPGGTYISQPEVGENTRITWAPVPTDRKGVKVQGYGGHYVIFFKDAPNTEKMFQVSEFLNSNEACDIIFSNSGFLPGLLGYLSTVDENIYPGLKFYFDSQDTADEWSSPARCPMTDFSRTQWNELRESVYRDEMTAEAAATEFQSRLESEWEALGI